MNSKLVIPILAFVIAASGCVSSSSTSDSEINQSIEENIRWGAAENVEHFDRVNSVDVSKDNEGIGNITPEDLDAETFRYVNVDLILKDDGNIEDDFKTAKESAIKTMPYGLSAHKSVLSVRVHVSKRSGEQKLTDLGSVMMTRVGASNTDWNNIGPEDLEDHNLDLKTEKPERELDQLVRTGNFDRDEKYEEVITSYANHLLGYSEDTEAAYEMLSTEVKSNNQQLDYSNSIKVLKKDYERQGVTFELSNVETVDENINSAEVEVTMEMQLPSGVTTKPSGTVDLILEEGSWKIDEEWNPYSM